MLGSSSRPTHALTPREIIGGLAEGILGWIPPLVSFIRFLARRDHKCLHDLVAGTVVIHAPNKVIQYRAM
jgi:uncharacterized RDD family membrane protein YckC